MGRRVILGVAVATFFGAAALAVTASALAQQRVAARVDGITQIEAGPLAVERGARGVIASGALLTATGVTDRLYVVSGPNRTSMAANQQETPRMDAVMASVENLRGRGGFDLRDAKLAMVAVVNQQIVTAPGRFVRNNKGVDMPLFASAVAFDNMGFPRISARGDQSILVRDQMGRGINLGAVIQPESTTRAPLPGQMISGFVVNRDPLAIEWGSSMHEITVELGAVRLVADSEPGGTSAAAAHALLGSFVNGTLDVETTSPATDLFSMSLALSAVDGAAADVALDFDYLIDPGIDPSMRFVRDSAGNATLEAVRAEMLRQFSTPRTDASLGTFYGFEPQYLITMGIPGMESSSVLYLDQIGATASAIPEPSGILSALVGVLAAALVTHSNRRRVPVARMADRHLQSVARAHCA